MKNTKIAILGGSFDPVHLGHIQLALQVQKQFDIEHIIFLPCGTPALKQTCRASSLHRVNMLKLAIEPYKGFSIDEREIHRDGPSYAIDTLKSFRKEYGSEVSIAFIIGEDAFAALMRWHQWELLLEYCHIINTSRENLKTPYPQPLKQYIQLYKAHHIDELTSLSHGKIFSMAFTNQPYSSTDIRQALEDKTVINGLSPKVKQYIIDHQLYNINPH
jgi:nicotinate-nucleotide adenylyltransferase